jgi:hypothetical protein
MPNEIDGDLLSLLETLAAHLAFWNKQQGEGFVRELLTLLVSEPAPPQPWLTPLEELVKVTTRESLEATALELETVGLKKLAAIVREYAADRPSELDLSPYVPGSIDHRAWLEGMKRKGY